MTYTSEITNNMSLSQKLIANVFDHQEIMDMKLMQQFNQTFKTLVEIQVLTKKEEKSLRALVNSFYTGCEYEKNQTKKKRNQELLGIKRKATITEETAEESKQQDRCQRSPSAIASVGKVNLKTGEANKFDSFNVYKIWENSTVEIYETEKGITKYVVTSGQSPLHTRIGGFYPFCADQTGRRLGDWKLIDSMPLEDLKNSNYKNAVMYTYK